MNILRVLKVFVLISSSIFYLIGCHSLNNNEDYQQEQEKQEDDDLNTYNETLNNIKKNVEMIKTLDLNNDPNEYDKKYDKYINIAKEELKNYLINNEKIDIKFLESISSVEVSDNEDYIMVRLDKYSGTVINYKPYNIVEILDKDIELSHTDYRIISVDGEPVLFIYETNNQNVRIYAYKIKKTGLKEVKPLKSKADDDSLWRYNKVGFIDTKRFLTNNMTMDITDDGKEVRFSVEDIYGDNKTHILVLNLNEDGQYEKKEEIVQGEDKIVTNNKSLKKIKENIDKAHQVGAGGSDGNLKKADKYIEPAMEELKQYLLNTKEKDIEIEFINNITGVKVTEDEDYILVEYDKHYYTYGGGTLGNFTCWKVLKYKPYNIVEIIEDNSPLLLSSDYRMATIEGYPTLLIYGGVRYDKSLELFINEYRIKETGITKIQPLQSNKSEDSDELWICDNRGFITTKERENWLNIAFDYISEDGREVRIKTMTTDEQQSLNLRLNKTGQYEY